MHALLATQLAGRLFMSYYRKKFCTLAIATVHFNFFIDMQLTNQLVTPFSAIFNTVSLYVAIYIYCNWLYALVCFYTVILINVSIQLQLNLQFKVRVIRSYSILDVFQNNTSQGLAICGSVCKCQLTMQELINIQLIIIEIGWASNGAYVVIFAVKQNLNNSQLYT